MAEPNGSPATSGVRPVISLFAVLALIEGFGGSLGGIAVEFVAGVYKYPVSNQLAINIATVCTAPLKFLFIVVAVRWGWMKIE